MKVKLLRLNDLKMYMHPAARLFRAIELRAVYNNTRGISFKQPSMDLGCGDGYISSLLFDGKFTYGVDNGEAHDVDIAIKKNRYGKVLLESAEEMSLKDNSLNFVFSNSVIEHIPGNDAVLSEVSRVLKKGGVFMFTSPSDKFKEYLYVSDRLSSLRLGFLADRYKDSRNSKLNHYHTYSHKVWTEKLRINKMKVTKFAYYISKETCMLWDKMALETKLLGLFDKNAERKMYEKYKGQVKKAYESDRVEGDQGASLFIYAVKQ